MVLVGPTWIAAIVLAVAGCWKLTEPGPARDALRALASARWWRAALRTVAPVRVIGLGEVALAVAVVVFGGRLLSSLLALAYLGFAAVAERLRRVPGGMSCGCFGRQSTPPGPLHVGVNLAAAAFAAAAAVVGLPSFADTVSELPMAGIPAIVGALVGAAATVAVLTVLPDVRAAAAVATGRTDPPAGSGQTHLFGPTIGLRPGLNVTASDTASSPSSAVEALSS